MTTSLLNSKVITNEFNMQDNINEDSDKKSNLLRSTELISLGAKSGFQSKNKN